MVAETGIPLDELDVPLWPAEAFPFESPQGIFARFAVRNNLSSAAVFAAHVGVNWRNGDSNELCRFVMQYEGRIRNLHRVVAATPIAEGRLLRLNGQLFLRSRDWSMKVPRVCVGCLGEGAYHRNWWDIGALLHCPIHDLPLVSGRGASKLARWRTHIGVTIDEKNIAVSANRVEVSEHPWERYALGRMGVLPPVSIDYLDGAEMFHIIDAMDLLGRLHQFGTTRLPRRVPRQVQAKIIAAGAGYLFSGRDGVASRIREFVAMQHHKARQEGRSPYQAIFHDRLQRIARKNTNPVLHWVRAIVDEQIASMGVYVHKRNRQLLYNAGGPVTLKQLSLRLQISKARVLAVAEKLGISRIAGGTGKYLAFLHRDAVQIECTVAQLLCRSDAAVYAGLDMEQFNSLDRNGVLIPFSCVGRSQGTKLFTPSEMLRSLRQAQARLHGTEARTSVLETDHDHLRSGDVRSEVRCLAQLCIRNGLGSPKGRIRAFLNGEAPFDSREYRPRSTHQLAGISRLDAATRLGISTDSLKTLIVSGHLVEAGSGAGGHQRIEETSLVEFANEFVAAHTLADRLGCRRSLASKRLQLAGLSPIPALQGPRATFFRRSDVVGAFGSLASASGASEGEEFWTALDGHLRRLGSCMKLSATNDPLHAKLLSGDRRLVVMLHINESRNIVCFEVVCDATKSARRHQIVRERQAEIASARPTIEFLSATDGRVVALREKCPFDVSDPAKWISAFEWLDQSMIVLRWIFRRPSGTSLPIRNINTLATGIICASASNSSLN